MKPAYLIITGIIMTACTHSASLERYSKELIRSSKPGKNISSLLAHSEELLPFERMSTCYGFVLDRWEYSPDEDGYDKPQNAENLLQYGVFTGDCEDQACIFMAVARELDIPARFCLGRSRGNETGHIWVELKINNSYSFKENRLSGIRRLFPNEEIISDESNLWLALIGKEEYNAYIKEYYINLN